MAPVANSLEFSVTTFRLPACVSRFLVFRGNKYNSKQTRRGSSLQRTHKVSSGSFYLFTIHRGPVFLSFLESTLNSFAQWCYSVRVSDEFLWFQLVLLWDYDSPCKSQIESNCIAEQRLIVCVPLFRYRLKPADGGHIVGRRRRRWWWWRSCNKLSIQNGEFRNKNNFNLRTGTFQPVRHATSITRLGICQEHVLIEWWFHSWDTTEFKCTHVVHFCDYKIAEAIYPINCPFSKNNLYRFSNWTFP